MHSSRRTLASAVGVVVASLALAGEARAQSLNDLAIQRLNADAQSLWAKDGIQLAVSQGTAELQKLVGVPHPITKHLTATITQVNSVTLDAPYAPGVTRLDQNGIDAKLPLQGKWTLAASCDVHVEGKFLGIKTNKTYTIKVEVKDLTAEIKADFDSSDPTWPRVKKVHAPDVDWKLKVTTSS